MIGLSINNKNNFAQKMPYKFNTAFSAKINPHSKKNNLSKKILISVGSTAGFVLADLFLAKGKILATLTRGKVSFIKTMSEELDNVVKNDSYATKNRLEAFLSVPGLHAVWNHRVIHKLHEWKVPVLPRVLQNVSRFFTGIEIHPGAKLGKNVFIDHTGAIIGETAEIGNNVTLIGRVVLGSTGKGSDYLRHTVVEEGSTLGMNSTMLGRIKIGKNSKVGAGALVTHNVPASTTVIGNPAKIITVNNEKLDNSLILNKNSQKDVDEYLRGRYGISN